MGTVCAKTPSMLCRSGQDVLERNILATCTTAQSDLQYVRSNCRCLGAALPVHSRVAPAQPGRYMHVLLHRSHRTQGSPCLMCNRHHAHCTQGRPHSLAEHHCRINEPSCRVGNTLQQAAA